MSTVVKIVCCVSADVHTRKTKVSTLAELKSVTASWFGGELILDYVDGDGDEIRLDSESEWRDLVAEANAEGKPARLRLRRPGMEVPVLPASGTTMTFANFMGSSLSNFHAVDSTSSSPQQQDSNKTKSAGSVPEATPSGLSAGGAQLAAPPVKDADLGSFVHVEEPAAEPAATPAPAPAPATAPAPLATAAVAKTAAPSPMEELASPFVPESQAKKPNAPVPTPAPAVVAVQEPAVAPAPVAEPTPAPALAPVVAPAPIAAVPVAPTPAPAVANPAPTRPAPAPAPVAVHVDVKADATNPFLPTPAPTPAPVRAPAAAPAAAAGGAAPAARSGDNAGNALPPPAAVIKDVNGRYISSKVRPALRAALPLISLIYGVDAESAILGLQGAVFKGGVRIQANLSNGEINFDVNASLFQEHIFARVLTLLNQGDYPLAVHLAADTVTLFQESQSARYNYALCLAKCGQKDAAIVQLQHAVYLGADAAQARADPDFACCANDMMFRTLGASDEEQKLCVPLMELFPNMTVIKASQLLKKHKNDLEAAAADFLDNTGAAPGRNPFLA
jgi:hypothetical protein